MRHVVHVAQHQLQRVLARLQIQFDLGLAAAEMNMVFIRRKCVLQLFFAIGAFGTHQPGRPGALLDGFGLICSDGSRTAIVGEGV